MLTSLSPSWFAGYDVLLEAGFAIAALIIALVAFQIYRLTDQKQVRLFGISFLLISISYVLQSILNLLVVTRADQVACGIVAQQSVNLFGAYGLYARMILMIAGLVLLAYMTLKIEKIRVFWLLFTLTTLGMIFSISPLHAFFATSTFLLAIVLWHFVNNYRHTKQAMTLLTAIAFAFLLFGNLHFLLSVNHELYYAIGHILEFAAYLLILINLHMVLRNGKKA